MKKKPPKNDIQNTRNDKKTMPKRFLLWIVKKLFMIKKMKNIQIKIGNNY